MDGDEFGFSNLSITIYIYISMHQNQFTKHYHKYFQEERWSFGFAMDNLDSNNNNVIFSQLLVSLV